MPKSQNPNIPNVYAPLLLDSVAPNLPQVRSENLQPVYPVEPGWLGFSPVLYGDSSVIGAATFNYNVDMIGARPGSATLDTSELQVWNSLYMRWEGGTVGNIQMEVSLINGSTTIPFWYSNMANPSVVIISSIMCPPGWDVNVASLTNAGAGDTFTLEAMGVQAAAGMPVPIIPTGYHGPFT